MVNITLINILKFKTEYLTKDAYTFKIIISDIIDYNGILNIFSINIYFKNFDLVKIFLKKAVNTLFKYIS